MVQAKNRDILCGGVSRRWWFWKFGDFSCVEPKKERVVLKLSGGSNWFGWLKCRIAGLGGCNFPKNRRYSTEIGRGNYKGQKVSTRVVFFLSSLAVADDTIK